MKPDAPTPDGSKKPPLLTLAALCCVLVAAGCTTETKYKWLSRIFDGVPAPGATTTPPANPDEETLTPGTNIVAVAAVPIIPHTLHPPFHDQNCTECHESKFSQKMKGPMNTVCFACHDDFLEKAKVKHQPAESGECSSCHDPHESPNKKLLVRVGGALCFECHETADIAKINAHKIPERDNCLACHDPHASANAKLLKKVMPKTAVLDPADSPPAGATK